MVNVYNNSNSRKECVQRKQWSKDDWNNLYINGMKTNLKPIVVHARLNYLEGFTNPNKISVFHYWRIIGIGILLF